MNLPALPQMVPLMCRGHAWLVAASVDGAESTSHHPRVCWSVMLQGPSSKKPSWVSAATWRAQHQGFWHMGTSQLLPLLRCPHCCFLRYSSGGEERLWPQEDPRDPHSLTWARQGLRLQLYLMCAQLSEAMGLELSGGVGR